MACSAAQQLLPPAPTVPVLTLLPTTSTVYIEYGRVPSFSLLPCLTMSSSSGCGAVAYVTVYSLGVSSVMDLTSRITVTDTTPCTVPADGSDPVCLSCSPVSMSIAQSCGVGVFTYQ